MLTRYGPDRRALCLALMASVGGGAFAAAAPPRDGLLPTAPATAPLLSFDLALRQANPAVSDLRWLGAHTLMASIRGPWDAPARMLTWPVGGGRAAEVATGDYGAVSPDGRWLAFFDGGWRLRELATGAVRSLGEDPPRQPWIFSAPTWSRDSRWVAVLDLVRPPDARPSAAVEKRGEVEVIDLGAATVSPMSGAGVGPRVALFPVSGGAARVLSVPEDILYYGEWGAGARYYFAPLQSYFEGKTPYSTVREIDADTGVVRDVFRHTGLHTSLRPRLSPDGRGLAITLDIDNDHWDDFVSLVLVDLATGSRKALTTGQFVENAAWAADGRSLYYLARDGGMSQLHQVTVDGVSTTLTHDAVLRRRLNMSPDRRWVSYTAQDGYGRHEVRVWSVREQRERIVARLNSPPPVRLGAFATMSWPAPDGLMIRGFVIRPPGYDPGRNYPLFVDIHGGGNGSPLTLHSSAFGADTPLGWHALAALGYVVFVPDMRSSGEYGPEIAPRRYAEDGFDPSGILTDTIDIAAGIRWLIEQGGIDPKRIAVLGHSAGGPRAMHLISTTQLFAAAILHDPSTTPGVASQLPDLTGRGLGGRLLTEFNRSTPSQKPEAFSGGPTFEGYNSRTPTLILLGNEDRGAVPPISAEVMFSLLRTNGVPTQILRYPGDGHIAGSLATALDRYRRIVDWLGKYAPPGPT